MQNIYTPVDQNTPLFMQGFIASGFGNPVGSLNGYTTVQFTPGLARSNGGAYLASYPGSIVNQPGNITVDSTVVGANGCFPFPISAITPASGSYAFAPCYLVSNSGGTTNGSLNPNITPAVVIGTSTTGFVPSQYDTWQEIGFVIIQSDGTLEPYVMNGNFETRTVLFQTVKPVLSAGAAVIPTAFSLQLGVAGSYLSAQRVRNVNLSIEFTSVTITDVGVIAPTGILLTLTDSPSVNSSVTTQPQFSFMTLPVGTDVNGNAALQYELTSNTSSMSVGLIGFDYQVPFGAVTNLGVLPA